MLYPFCKLYFYAQIITRIILTIYALAYKQINYLNLPEIFSIGLISDLIPITYLLPWFYLHQSLMSYKTKRLVATIFDIFGFAVFSLIIYITAAIEIIFWDEFGTRLNFIAVDYIVYTHEIIGTIKDNAAVIGAAFATLTIWIISIKVMAKNVINTTLSLNLKQNLIRFLLSLISCAILFNFYSSDKLHLSTNEYVKELSKNGLYELFSAFRNNSLNYTRFYPKIEQEQAFTTLKEKVLQPNQSFINPTQDSILRTNSGSLNAKHNIIMIIVESLSAEFMGRFGNTQNITPYLDKLASESIFFTNFYATGTRTVRGLEAILLSVPPTPGSSIVRRPSDNKLFTAASIFKKHDYDISFIYGGYGYFDNMLNFFSNNGYHFIDRSNLTDNEISFANVWGVADEDIFNKSLKYFDSLNEKPFFSVILTTSNHRPYDFPEGRIDLQNGTRAAAVKYTDFAIGKFIEEAKNKPWFDNTIFVIVADHCASSAGKTNLPIHKYHIPLLIYAPKITKPQEVKNLSSQIDVMPTILGILGLEHTTKFFGRDMLNHPQDRAFISTYQMLGYLKNNQLAILAPQKQPQIYDVDTKEQKPSSEYDQKLINEAISFYQGAYILYTNNQMLE